MNNMPYQHPADFPAFQRGTMTTFAPEADEQLHPVKVRLRRNDAYFAFFLSGSTGGAAALYLEQAFARRWRDVGDPYACVVTIDNLNLYLNVSGPHSIYPLLVTSQGQIRDLDYSVRMHGVATVSQISAVSDQSTAFYITMSGSSGALSNEAGHSTAVQPQVEEQLAEPDELGQSVPERSARRTLDVVEHLRDFFGLTDEALGDLVDIGRTTIASWRGKDRRKPRSSTIAPLLKLGAIVASLRSHLGDVVAYNWFMSGTPARLSRVKSDPNVYSEAYDIIFERSERQAERGIVGNVDIEVTTGAAREPALVRRPRRRVSLIDRQTP